MTGGLVGEESVVWRKGDAAPMFGAEPAAPNCTKALEAAREESQEQKISAKQIICLLVVILVFVLSAAGTAIMWGTNMFEDAIDQQLVLRNGSDALEKWRRPPVDAIISFWIFNYTNVDAFREGLEPKLRIQEVGPFAFREKGERVNIKFHENGTLTYQDKKQYEFLPERSGASLEDVVVAVNIPLMSMNYQARKLNYLQWLGASAALNLLDPQPLFVKTAREMFYGYKDSLTTIAEFKVKGVKMGILESTNGTSPDTLTIYSGTTGIDMMGKITRFNGLDHVDFYPGEECNRVDGSDGTKFPPASVVPGGVIQVYHRDACRKVPLVYKESVTVWDDIPALRFSPPDNVFDNGDDNPDNECYCQETYYDECQPSGVGDGSHCKDDAPIFVSFPHFYKADPVLLQAVEGLKPDADRHEMFIDIHQRLGAPLAVRSRFQINILMKDVMRHPLVAKVNGKLLPIMWMERVLDEFPPDVRSVIGMVTFTVPVVKAALSYGCPLLVAVTALVLLVCAYIEVAALLRKDPPPPVAPESHNTRL